VFITYGGGGALIALVMLLRRGGNLAQMGAVPWYAFLSGVLGLVIVGALGYGATRLGLTVTLTLMVGAQFLAGAVMDHFGILGAMVPLDASRLAGMGLLLAGVWLIVR
jgi:transporter family-2 protein